MATRVYKYRLRPPTVGAHHVEDQMRAAHRYQHTLTTIERARRAAYVAARRRLVGDLDEAERVLETARSWVGFARDYVSLAHMDSRSKRTTPEMRARVSLLRDALKLAAARVSAIRAESKSDPELRREASDIDERAAIVRKAARATCGVYWGTYLLVEAAADQARRGKTDPAYRRIVSHGYLHEDDRMGDGSLGVQIQGGMPCISVMGSDNRIRIDPLPDDQWDTRSGRRRARTRVHLRVGSDGREPIWATWPMMMHRPLPRDGVIKTAAVTRRVRGTRIEWHLTITVQEPEPEQSPNPRVVAVHLGWRARPGGRIRIAMIADDDGRMEEMLLDDDDQWLAAKDRELRGLLDDTHNLCVRYVRAWLSTSPAVPDWWSGRTRALPHWRAHRNLVRLAEHWRDHRFAGDARIFAIVWHWRNRWRHLYQWATGCARRLDARRTEQRRVLAARLASEYGTIVMDSTDYAAIARRAPAEERDEEAAQASRHARRLASPGDMRATIEMAARKRGVSWRLADPAGLSTTCHACGGTCQYDAREHLHHACEHCGAVWDQDENAALNLLARERSGHTLDPATSRAPRKRSRFSRHDSDAEAAE